MPGHVYIVTTTLPHSAAPSPDLLWAGADIDINYHYMPQSASIIDTDQSEASMTRSRDHSRPIRGQYSGQVITLGQWVASMVTWDSASIINTDTLSTQNSRRFVLNLSVENYTRSPLIGWEWSRDLDTSLSLVSLRILTNQGHDVISWCHPDFIETHKNSWGIFHLSSGHENMRLNQWTLNIPTENESSSSNHFQWSAAACSCICMVESCFENLLILVADCEEKVA